MKKDPQACLELFGSFQAGVREGGQGAAHGCGLRAARRGEDGDGPEGEERKARL